MLGDEANNDTDFGSLNFVGQTVTISEDSGTELFGASTADSLTLTSAGAITDASDADLSVVGTTIFSATGDIVIGDEANNIDNFGTLTFNGVTVSIGEDSDTILLGTNSAVSLSLTSAGAITDASDADVDVTGAAAFTATGDITLGDEANNIDNFGTLTFTGAAVSISEDSDTELFGVSSAGSLELTSAGAITDASDADLSVTGAAVFTATGDIVIGDEANNIDNFGTLTFNGVTVSISEDSDTELLGMNAADSLTLSSSGAITDASDADLNVTGGAVFTATGDITLGDEANNIDNFDTLTFTGAAVSIGEDSATVLSGESTAASLALTSAGPITDASDADIDVTGVTGVASFIAGGDITLGDEANNDTDFGSLNFVGQTVTINEDSGTNLFGVSTADSLMLTSGGAITDASDADLDVTGGAVFTATGDITLGDEVNNIDNFGTLNFTGAAVSISEDSDTSLVGANTADSLVLSSGGEITDDPDTDIAILGEASFIAVDDITLGDDANNDTNFGSLNFVGQTVTITEDSDTEFFGVSTADSLSLTSAGAITDASDADLDVTNAAVFTTTGDIVLGDEANNIDNFGTLTFTGAAVSISEDSDTMLVGTNTADSLVLASAGSIADAAGADLSVVGAASFDAAADITLGDEASNDTNFGSLNFDGVAVTIIEDSTTLLFDDNVASTLELTSAGAITDADNTTFTVATSASLLASRERYHSWRRGWNDDHVRVRIGRFCSGSFSVVGCGQRVDADRFFRESAGRDRRNGRCWDTVPDVDGGCVSGQRWRRRFDGRSSGDCGERLCRFNVYRFQSVCSQFRGLRRHYECIGDDHVGRSGRTAIGESGFCPAGSGGQQRYGSIAIRATHESAAWKRLRRRAFQCRRVHGDDHQGRNQYAGGGAWHQFHGGQRVHHQ